MSRYTNDFDEDVILRVVIAYLYEGKSHRKIQREILGLPAPARGGGFVAMDILHGYEIDGSKKGILKNQNLSEFMDKTTGKLNSILKKVAEYKQVEKSVKDNLKKGEFNIQTNTTEIISETKSRVNQSILRKYVLDIYGNKCAICGIDKPDLLVCSHIKPWRIDKENRLNPSNTICLCVLHDKLFDRGYFSFDKNYNIIFGEKADSKIKYMMEGLVFKAPTRYRPEIQFLDYHYNEICKK